MTFVMLIMRLIMMIMVMIMIMMMMNMMTKITVAITKHSYQEENEDVDKEESRTVQNYFLIHFVDETLIDDE